MFKKIGFIIAAIILIVIFFEPVRNYLNNLAKGKKDVITEEHILGMVSGYNPRIEELQENLKKAGLDPGPIDGRMGWQTRNAIKEFQKNNGLKSTGKIDSKTWAEINREKESITAEEKAKTPKPKLNEDIQDEIMTYRLKSKGRVREIQTALKNAGFDPGEIDGKMGTKTKSAIKEFQKMKGLPADGIVGTKTWNELKMYIPKEELKGDKR